jgi:glycosyltransferase involved in cell wall biosynthesis
MPPHSYRVVIGFYRRRGGPPGSKRALAAKLLQHAPNMLALDRRSDRCDILHFQWLAVQPLDLFVLPRRRPLVLTAHDILPHEGRPGQEAAQRRLYHRFDAVIAHTRRGRDRLVSEVGVAPEKITVIPIGAYNHLTHVANRAPLPPELRNVEGPVALFFGKLRPNKGLDVLLSAWREVDHGELWIVGAPGMDVASLQRSAPPRTRFITRWVSESEVPAFFERADVVVLPYRRIEQSGVALTALAFERPMVLADVGGLGEIAATGAGVLFPPGDALALADALTSLFADETRRDRMRARAAQAKAGEYSWQSIAERTLAVYEGLAP